MDLRRLMVKREGWSMTEQEFALRAQDQRGRLYRTAFLYLGGEHAAVDAVDEAVYRAFGTARKLRQPSSSRPG